VRVLVLALAWGMLLTAGCPMSKLNRELTEMTDERGSLRGSISGEWNPEQYVVLVLLEVEGDEPRLSRFRLYYQSGEFSFIAIPPGSYHLGAFLDEDSDLVYDPGEPLVKGMAVEVAAGEEYTDLDLVVDTDFREVAAIHLDLGDTETISELEFNRYSHGEVTTIDDPRFNADHGPLGMWQPMKFLDDVGGGLFLLDEYDPDKMPILFVHGISGTPADFTTLISRLDRDRFLPMVFFYPSALRLKMLGGALAEVMAEVRARHGFDEFILVAHSMGGLVSRSFVDDWVDLVGDQHGIRLFVTISTPWNGHAAAALGVKWSPAVVPSWVDIAPGSPFQQAMKLRELEPGIPHYVLFGYQGGNSSKGPDDGVVTVTSQLPVYIQNRATKVYGFHEDHMSILSSDAPLATFDEILEQNLVEEH
jgi:hypothetical protein